MDLLGIQAFVAVAERSSLTKAATRLGLSASTISRRLTDLEAQLGVRLIERSTRSVRVTDAGKAFQQACARGLDELANAAKQVAENQQHVSGTVRIGTAPNLGPLLLGAIASVQREHPDVHVVMTETERLQDRALDAIDLFVRVGTATDERLVSRPLGSYPHVLVSSRAYLARAGTPTRPGQLASHRLMGFTIPNARGPVRLYPRDGGAPVELAARLTFSSNDYDTLREAVLSGMGIAELPAILAVGHASLVPVLPRWTLGEAKVNLLFASDRLLARAVRVVCEALLAHVPKALALRTRRART